MTNLNFFVAGEVNDTCWAPKFLNYGTNLWIFATCSTNGNISHFIRGMYCPSNNFPFGFTGLFMVTQSETNMIDFSPWYEPSSGKSGAWFKNETTTYVELGEWSNSTPTSIFTNVLTGNFAGFGGNQEAPFMEFIPGGYALLMDDYGGQTINGNANDPGYYQISYSTNIESPSAWSYPSNVDFGGYHFASFVPVNLTTANDQFYAIQRMVSSMSGSPQHMIISSITNGYRLYGFSGSSDMAGFNLGNEFYSAGGIYGDGNGATHIYTSTGDGSKTTPFQGPNTLDAIIISGGNSVAIAPGLTLSGNASGLTNIPPTSLSAGTTFNNVDIPTNALGTHGYSGYFTNGVFVSTGTY